MKFNPDLRQLGGATITNLTRTSGDAIQLSVDTIDHEHVAIELRADDDVLSVFVKAEWSDPKPVAPVDSGGYISGTGNVWGKLGTVDGVQWCGGPSGEQSPTFRPEIGEQFFSTAYKPRALTDAQLVRAASLSYRHETGNCRMEDGEVVGERGSQLHTAIVEMRPDLKGAIRADIDEMVRRNPRAY